MAAKLWEKMAAYVQYMGGWTTIKNDSMLFEECNYEVSNFGSLASSRVHNGSQSTVIKQTNYTRMSRWMNEGLISALCFNSDHHNMPKLALISPQPLFSFSPLRLCLFHSFSLVSHAASSAAPVNALACETYNVQFHHTLEINGNHYLLLLSVPVPNPVHIFNTLTLINLSVPLWPLD